MSSDEHDEVVRTYVDSSVLLAVIRGPEQISDRALALLSESNRVFLSRDIVRLEVLPKAVFHRQEKEAAFYLRYFEDVEASILTTPSLVVAAFEMATHWNLSGLDALHVAAAIELGASELVTAERQTSPLVRVRTPTLRVVSVRDDQSA